MTGNDMAYTRRGSRRSRRAERSVRAAERGPRSWTGAGLLSAVLVLPAMNSRTQEQHEQANSPGDLLGVGGGHHGKNLAEGQLEYVPDELLVKFIPGAPASAVARGLRVSELKIFRDLGVRHWQLPKGLPVDQARPLLFAEKVGPVWEITTVEARNEGSLL